MTRHIFRLERVAHPITQTPANEHRPLAAVGRLVGWLRDEVFTRYELIEHRSGAHTTSDNQAKHLAPASPQPQQRPHLRIVMVHDTTKPSAGRAARMVISGRMADVCAELDRLAA